MPAININGGGGAGGAGAGNGLQASIDALTAAVNRNTAAQGNGGGAGGGGGRRSGRGSPVPGHPHMGPPDDRANAFYTNADINVRDRYQQRIINAAKRRDAQQDAERARIEQTKTKWFIDNENLKHGHRQRLQRQEEREYKQKTVREEREKKAAATRSAREAAKEAAAEDRFIIANHEKIWRTQQAAIKRASVSPRAGRTPEEVRAAFDYRLMRADADLMNQQHDRAQAGGGGGGRRGGGGGRFGSWSNDDSSWSKKLSPSGLGDLRRGIMNNSVTGTVVMGAIAAVSSPMILAAFSSQIMRLAQPFFDFQIDTMRMGRAGGFESGGLRKALYPGGAAPDWMKQYGYTPQSATQTLSALGLNRGAETSVDILKSLGAAEQMPGMGLTHEQLGQGLKQATTLGMVNPDDEGSRNDYWQRLQKTMITAQTYSLDHADSQRNIQALLAQAASAGAGAGTGKSIMDAWERGVSSGLPGARNGDITGKGLAGMDAMSNNAGPGGDAGVAMDTQLFFSKPANGGHLPGTIEELRKHFDSNGNKGALDTYMATPAGQSTVDDYLGAMKAGNVRMAVGFLGEMRSGRPDLQLDIARGGRASLLPDYSRNTGVAGAAGGGLTFTRSQGGAEVTILPGQGTTAGAQNNNWTNLDYRTDQGAMGYSQRGDHRFGVYATPEGGVAAGLRQVLYDQDHYKLGTLRELITKRSPPYVKKNGVMVRENDTEALIANIAQSAGVDPNAPLNMRDPAIASRVMTAMSIHESGMGRTPEQQAVVARGVAMGLGSNNPSGANAATANNGQQGMAGAEQMSTFALNLGGAPGNIMLDFSSSIIRATQAVDDFVKKIAGWVSGPSTSGPHSNPTGVAAQPPVTQGVGQYPPRRAYPDMSGMGSGDPSTM